MDHKISHFAAVLVGAAAVLASASSAACSLVPADPIRIKQMMAREIAHRLGMRPQQIALDAITQPRLHTPLALGADCSGLGAYHHSAGFRIGQSRPGPGPVPRPWPGRGPVGEPAGGADTGPTREPDAGPIPGPDRDPARPWPRPNPQCVYEGVAVVLGYGYSSPVAVNFERRCR